MALALADVAVSQASSRDGDGTITAIKVLVVHECPLIRAGLRSIIEQEQDMEVVGEAGEKLPLPAWIHLPDVVVLSDDLPGNLLELIDQLRRARVPGIFVLTVSPEEEMLFRLLQHGASAYEWSHISAEGLLTKIRRVARGECLISGDVLLAQAARREPSTRKENSKEQVETTVPEDCPLSAREREVLAQIVAGHRGQQIKEALCISEQTVKNHLTSILKKLAVSDRTAAVALALHHHWIDFAPAGERPGRQRDIHTRKRATAEQTRAASSFTNR